MAKSFSKVLLSGSTNGKGIKITTVATPGDLIHTAIAGAVNFDEIILFGSNSDNVDHLITVQFGGTTTPDDYIVVLLPANQGSIPILNHLLLQNGLIIRVFADLANKVSIFGSVNRIS